MELSRSEPKLIGKNGPPSESNWDLQNQNLAWYCFTKRHGGNEIRTHTKGVKIPCANHYTIPQHPLKVTLPVLRFWRPMCYWLHQEGKMGTGVVEAPSSPYQRDILTAEIRSRRGNGIWTRAKTWLIRPSLSPNWAIPHPCWWTCTTPIRRMKAVSRYLNVAG